MGWGEMYKNVTLIVYKMAIPAAHRAPDDAIIMTYINSQLSASNTIMACWMKLKFKVSVWMYTVGELWTSFSHCFHANFVS